MNRRLVAVSLIGLVLALTLGYVGTQVVVIQRFFFFNAGTGVWVIKSLMSIVSSSATLFWALLFVGIAGLGRRD